MSTNTAGQPLLTILERHHLTEGDFFRLSIIRTGDASDSCDTNHALLAVRVLDPREASHSEGASKTFLQFPPLPTQRPGALHESCSNR